MNRRNTARVIDAKTKTIEELGLFEQNKYCSVYISHKHSLSPKEAEVHANIAAACFRQAREFVISSSDAPVATKPLLLSYAFNNYLKGSAYLLSLDNKLLSQFNRHGIGFENTKGLLQSKVVFQRAGAYVVLEELYSYRTTPAKEKMELGILLGMIPGLENIYFKSTNELPLVFSKSHAIQSETPDEHVKSFMDKYWPNGRDGKPYDVKHFGQRVFGEFYVGAHEVMDKKILPDVMNDEYSIMPIHKGQDLIWLPPICSSYAIMMAYSMLARYHAEKWYSFIDPATSTNYILINSSIDYMFNIFIKKIHNSLFGISYISGKLTDDEFVRMFISNEREIMKRIKREL